MKCVLQFFLKSLASTILDFIAMSVPTMEYVCIEAHPGPFAKLVENRPQAINVQCAAFDGSKDVVTFQANSGGTEMLSGIVANYDPRHVQRITNEGGRGNMIEVQAKTLDAILDEAGAPLIVDFLSIDVEGGELAVVKGLNKYKAKVIITPTTSRCTT